MDAELIIRRREYQTVKLCPESNVTIQMRFDALTCCVFTNIIRLSGHIFYYCSSMLSSSFYELKNKQ